MKDKTTYNFGILFFPCLDEVLSQGAITAAIVVVVALDFSNEFFEKVFIIAHAHKVAVVSSWNANKVGWTVNLSNEPFLLGGNAYFVFSRCNERDWDILDVFKRDKLCLNLAFTPLAHWLEFLELADQRILCLVLL